jgi:hypothetical protein
MKLIKENNIYKAVKIPSGRKYFKYLYTNTVSPKFSSQRQATAGVDGFKMITAQGNYACTGDSTTTINKNTVVTFDVGETSNGIISIGFTGVVVARQYPSLVMKTIQGSVDGSNWTTISSSYGGRNSVYTSPLSISSNNYRYIRFTAGNDDSDYNKGGCHNVTIKYNKRYTTIGNVNSYDYYVDTVKLYGVEE